MNKAATPLFVSARPPTVRTSFYASPNHGPLAFSAAKATPRMKVTMSAKIDEKRHPKMKPDLPGVIWKVTENDKGEKFFKKFTNGFGKVK